MNMTTIGIEVSEVVESMQIFNRRLVDLAVRLAGSDRTRVRAAIQAIVFSLEHGDSMETLEAAPEGRPGEEGGDGVLELR